MIFKTAAVSGTAFPSKIDLSYGSEPLSVFAFDENGNAVAANWYLTSRDGSSAFVFGSLSQNAQVFGNDPGGDINLRNALRDNNSAAYLPISGTSVTYFAPGRHALPVRAKLVATANGVSRELMIDIS